MIDQLKFLPYFYANPQFRFTGLFNGLKTIPAGGQNTWPIVLDLSSDFHIVAIQSAVTVTPDEGAAGAINFDRFQVADGTTRQLMDNPSMSRWFTWVQAPSWKIRRAGSINVTLYNDHNTALPSINPFIFQGLREYDSQVREEATYPHREEYYAIRVPISYTSATVNPPSYPQKRFTQVVSNFNFKLKRIRGFVYDGPATSLPVGATALPGVILYDYQLRALMDQFIPLPAFNYNNTPIGSLTPTNAASFPNLDLLYPVNSVIQVDIADLGGVVSGNVIDQVGELLYEGVNLIPCSADDPRRIQIPTSGGDQ